MRLQTKSTSRPNMSMADRLGRPPAVGSDRFARVSKCLDSCRKKPIVGIEYLVELYDQTFNTYECVLCKEELPSHTRVMHHMQSFDHRVNFLVSSQRVSDGKETEVCLFCLQKAHFPKTLKPGIKLLTTRSMQNPSEYLTERIEFICADIEERKGRLNPPVINKDEFKKNRAMWLKRIKEAYHFRENRAVLAFDEKDVEAEFKKLDEKRSRGRSKSPLDDRSKRRKAEADSGSNAKDGVSHSKETPVKR